MGPFHDKFFNLGIVGKFFIDPIMHSVSADVKLNLQKNKCLLHMCLVGRLNPYKLQQSWELTFLIGLTLLNTKLAKKNFFTDVL